MLTVLLLLAVVANAEHGRLLTECSTSTVQTAYAYQASQGNTAGIPAAVAGVIATVNCMFCPAFTAGITTLQGYGVPVQMDSIVPLLCHLQTPSGASMADTCVSCPAAPTNTCPTCTGDAAGFAPMCGMIPSASAANQDLWCDTLCQCCSTCAGLGH